MPILKINFGIPRHHLTKWYCLTVVLFVNVDMSSSCHALSTLTKNIFFSVYYQEKSCEAGLDIGIVLDKSLSVKQRHPEPARLD